MAVDALPRPEGSGDPHPATWQHFPRAASSQESAFFCEPLSALFMAIDCQGCVQDPEREAEATMAEGDEVVYYVNRDSAGWVEQHVRRRVYIELKLECTRNRTRIGDKSRDDWMCVYCKGAFPSKLRLTDHRVGGCPCGPVNSTREKWELPVYPNLKTAKQGKDLKLALQRGDGELWDNLHDEQVWLDLNPELKEVTPPPPGARVQVRSFMEGTLQRLTAYPPPPREFRSQAKGKAPLPPRPNSAPSQPTVVVDIDDDASDEDETPLVRMKKRSHAEMEGGHRCSISKRQWKAAPRKQSPLSSTQSVGEEQRTPNPPRPAHRVPPPHPIQVAPLQTRSPSPERGAILLPPPPPKQVPSTPAAHVPPDAPLPPVTPATRMETPTEEHDMALGLRKERHAFYLKAASAARGTVKMDHPKPPLMTPLEPPALYHLMACDLLPIDLEQGKFEDFEVQVHEWKTHPSFKDRLFMAFGRFCVPAHQVSSLVFSCPLCSCLFSA
jgi:hypothetical protein